MTAEVAIMNRSAVALAADSTVTIGDGEKTYSVNKLFTLSKLHPVGVMIYGDAAFMDVPWETLIKQYRKRLGDRSFDHVRDYAADVVKYLATLSDIFTDERQARYFKMTSYIVIRIIHEDIDTAVERKADGKSLSEAEIKSAVSEEIDDWRKFAEKYPPLPCVGNDFPDELLARYRDDIDEIIKEELGAFDLDKKDQDTIAFTVCRRIASGSGNRTGLVVAGFGDKEIFPAVYTLQIHRMLCGKVVYQELDAESSVITADNRASVIPFAQKEVVFSFLTGCEGSYVEMVESMFDEFFDSFPEVASSRVGSIVGKLDDPQRAKFVEQVGEDIKKVKADFFGRFEKYRSEKHIEPLFDVIGALRKEEMALIAEALVNLTSVKHKVSEGVESVGGPIDVAVISKGDGFVWINRKHYFRPELNPHFMETYFKR